HDVGKVLRTSMAQQRRTVAPRVNLVRLADVRRYVVQIIGIVIAGRRQRRSRQGRCERVLLGDPELLEHSLRRIGAGPVETLRTSCHTLWISACGATIVTLTRHGRS